MNFLKKYKNQSLFSLIGMMIGFFIARTTNIKFQTDVDPVELANLILTLILALLIGLYIEPSNTSTRIEKDLHIEKLKSVIEISKEIHTFFVFCFTQNPLLPENKEKMVSLFRSLSNQVDLFLGQAEYSKAKYIFDKEMEVKNKFYRFKRTFTGGQFSSVAFAYKNINFSTYEAQYLGFSKYINQLIIDINKK